MPKSSAPLLDLAKARSYDELFAAARHGTPEEIFSTAEYLREEDAYNAAIRLYELLPTGAENSDVQFGLGQCHGKAYDYGQALTHLRRAWSLDPDRTEGEHYYAYILERSGLMEEADEHYAAALAGAYGDDLWALSHYAYFNEKYGRPEKAERYYREVLQRNPAYTWAVKRLGLFLLAQGRVDEADRVMRDAVTRFPNSPFAVLNYLEFLLIRSDQEAYERYLTELDYDGLATPYQVLVDLFDYYHRFLSRGDTDAAALAAFEAKVATLDDSVHRDFDDLNADLERRGGDVDEWRRLIALLLR